MYYDFVEMFFGCGGVILVIALLIVPFIALYRTKRIEEIATRLRHLERELSQMRRERVPASPIVEKPPEVIAPAAAVDALVEESVPHRPPKRRPRPAPPRSEFDWETWLGARGLSFAAIILLLFATAFFFREIFDRNLIGPLGRIAIGVFFGCAACLAGYWQHRKGWPNTSQMLTAAGIVLLYLSAFASFGYYRLLDSSEAGIFLVLIVVEAFALAVVYEAPGIAIMAVIGGLLNPILLRTDVDRYVGFFSYLAILNAGVAGLLIVRRWRALALLTIVGTNLLFWLWYDANFHPTKFRAAIGFHIILAGLWLGQQLVGPLMRFASLDWEEAVRLFVQALLFAAAGYVLLDERIPDWMGTIALAVAIVHTALTWAVLQRRPADALHAMCEWTLAMGFLAAVMPLQAAAPWVAVCWSAQGLALWWFSGEIRSLPMRLMGFVFLTMGVMRFVVVQALEGGAHFEPFIPLANTFALSGLAIAGCLIVASLLGRRLKPSAESTEFTLARIVGLAGLFLIWVVLSAEAYDYFQTQRDINDPIVQAELPKADVERNREDFDEFVRRRDERLDRSSQVALSTVWGLYAIVLLTLGLKLPSAPLRWSALVLFGVTLLKVVAFDMRNLPGLYRVAAFFGLSLMMGAAAWGYQKVKISLLPADEEDRDAPPM
jgi:uncharacterized membrane protein